MELTKKERTIKYVVYAVILCLLSLLQNVGGLWLEIGGARCFLLVPAAVLLSLDEDEKASALIGLFAGLLWDITAVHHMGFSCLFLMVACYIMSVLLTHIFSPDFLGRHCRCNRFYIFVCFDLLACFRCFQGRRRLNSGVFHILFAVIFLHCGCNIFYESCFCTA